MDVDVAGVREVARRGDQAAEEVPGRTNAAWASADRAAGGSRGLASAAELDRCRSDWSRRLNQLSAAIEQHADDLRMSANRVEAADAANARHPGRFGSAL
jgi:uncharacterized protein YukE